ncbi:hypothetical protein M1271_06610 [Patescibacteria group bacterium]|nr:hypothetical protein [Patescibacteria group bacterium]MCL5798400.1 hypothetical protein [Patescibacteria group bacterium]
MRLVPLFAFINMSAEHGHSHSGESVTDIISTIVLCIFGLGFVLDSITEALEETVVGGVSAHAGH